MYYNMLLFVSNNKIYDAIKRCNKKVVLELINYAIVNLCYLVSVRCVREICPWWR